VIPVGGHEKQNTLTCARWNVEGKIGIGLLVSDCLHGLNMEYAATGDMIRNKMCLFI
jgi:hypothetical protein